MKLIQVRGNTFCIDTGMTAIPIYKINDEEIIMLDTGWVKEREGIENLLEENSLRIVGIINSHAHIDHIGNNDCFKKKYNCLIAMSAFEALLCSSTVTLKTYYSSQTLSEVEKHFGHMVCDTDIMIEDNQNKIYVCGIKFKIFHTPGHSPAHICIITPDNVAYLGDALISYEVMEGAKMPYAFILREDLKSKEKLYDLKCTKYIVAHKGIYSDQDITKLITDNLNFYKQRAAKIYSLIEEAMTLEDITKAVLKSFNISIGSISRYAVIERMLRSYVEYLNESGMISLKMEKGFLKYSKGNTDL
ncbi:MBL fold metallo-hydrolase [Desulfitobacterium metallireducens]|uniref:Hydrolase n=1 Tax=Desulfitobacterium metallireducens DSM 15288 TaxID=871968 RepID=W0EBP4_9FIRM|nr:MBL fold metallo-hydrolase [Desulfitobacterium metallireducens]AHF06496.1 hydrolase [Desulfitobacterium metallireducens DSM 15288]